MDLGLEGKRAIVTGGNRGIGRCCALALAREGARVCITARDRTLLDQTVGEINEAGGEGYAVSADLTTLEACRRVVDGAVDQFGSVDILVNCAGAARAHDILDLPTELIDDALGLKRGIIQLTRQISPFPAESSRIEVRITPVAPGTAHPELTRRLQVRVLPRVTPPTGI